MSDINEHPFEEAYKELEEVIDKLESGELSLEESVRMYERGQALSAYCQKLLDEAELRIQKLSADGNITPL